MPTATPPHPCNAWPRNPGGHAETAERPAALATYNQRITRACTAILVHLEDQATLHDDGVAATARKIGGALEVLAHSIETDSGPRGAAELAAQLGELELSFSDARLPALTPAGALSAPDLIGTHLAKCVVEIRAMALVLPPGSSDPK